MKKSHKFIATIGLMLVIAVSCCLIFQKRAADYKAFAKVMDENPQTYGELEMLVKRHIYDYSDEDKISFLGELEPLSESDQEHIKTNSASIVMYGNSKIGEISYLCSVFTFQQSAILGWTIQSLPQEHTVYFNNEQRIIGYESVWLLDDDDIEQITDN